MPPKKANSRINLTSLSPKPYWRELLAIFTLLLAIVFFRSERKELQAILPQIQQARPFWLLAGVTVTFIYIFFQGGMYRKSFAAIQLKLKWAHAVILFLKRNFVSVFLPAGGVSALAYSPSQIRKEGFHQPQVHQASGLFAFAGLLTIFIVGLPVVMYTIVATSRFKNAWLGLLAPLLIITLLVAAVRSIKQKKKLYRWIDKKFPSFTPTLNEVFAANVNLRTFSGAVAFSIGVEGCGMVHLYIAMLALGAPASFGASAAAYIISVLMMVLSPFLRGLGAVELSMAYVLQQFGYNSTQALSITILYRVFEFWLPLFAGFIALSWKGRKLFLRAAPVLLCFALGIVNIVSVITPPIHNRARLLREYLPLTTIHASHLLVLLIGLTLLGISAFLFRGLRNAWLIALGLSFFSLIGHLTKALDYEEAIFSGLTLVVLLTTASQYRIRSSNKWMQAGLKTALISFGAVALFGFLNFYFIKPRHFGVDFTWQESLVHTIRSILLAEDTTLHPLTRFAHELIWLIRALGFFTWTFLLFTLIKPHIKKYTVTENYRERALFLLNEFGNSAIDYFKVYKDKLFFFSDIHEAFVAYRIWGGFAIVLEEPVCAAECKVEVLQEFDRECRKMGLKPAFYRVDESSVLWFSQLKKRKLMIGQEAILNVNEFSLEGRDKKSLRNGLNSLQKKGYTVSVHTAPHTGAFLAALRKVSDEWLTGFGKEELIFSQGMFDEKELMQQDVIVVKDTDGAIKAFLNIIPDYAEEECTYDLIRKTNDAPPAVMDALIIQLIAYAKERRQLYVNLGLVPMSGISQPDNTAEQLIKLAAEKIKRFQHYKGLREFKEKYATLWENKYLVYDNDFDLLQLPLAIRHVMKP
jgi:phosphatidylglycerol lysyltransferase